ncbi:MAG: hypothetical protein H6713_14810 [Myxococcales bacterium]|nr:hypothetical protein [Myxococcales bacterium]
MEDGARVEHPLPEVVEVGGRSRSRGAGATFGLSEERRVRIVHKGQVARELGPFGDDDWRLSRSSSTTRARRSRSSSTAAGARARAEVYDVASGELLLEAGGSFWILDYASSPTARYGAGSRGRTVRARPLPRASLGPGRAGGKARALSSTSIAHRDLQREPARPRDTRSSWS